MVTQPSQDIDDRVYLERVRQYFGNTVGNAMGGFIAMGFIWYLLRDAGAPPSHTAAWAGLMTALLLVVAVIEQRFKTAELSVAQAKNWVRARIVSGAIVALAIGISPILFYTVMSAKLDMFILIISLTIVAQTSMSFAVMRQHTLAVIAATMVPMLLYLASKGDTFSYALAAAIVVANGFFLAKSRRVSKSVVSAIELNEQLRDEILSHQRTREQLHHMALHDPLTELPNRRRLMQWLDDQVDRVKREQGTIGVLFMDLNGFKAVNDFHGHDVGDALLKQIAGRLRSAMGPNDMLARHGGDEFVLASYGKAGTQADLPTLTKRYQTLMQAPIELPNLVIDSVGISVGSACYPDDGIDMVSVIKRADAAMYEAKRQTKTSL